MIVKFRRCHFSIRYHFHLKKKQKLYLYIGTQLESEVVTYPSDPPMARLLLNTPTSRWRCKSLPNKKTGCDVGVVWIVGCFFPCCFDCWFFELNEVSLFFLLVDDESCCWFFGVGLFEAHHPHQQQNLRNSFPKVHDVVFILSGLGDSQQARSFNWGSRPKLLLP